MFRSCCRYCAHPSQIMRWSRSFDQVAPSPSLLRRNQHSLPVEKPAWSPRSPQQLAPSLFKAFFLIYFPFELHLSFTIAWNETAFEGLSKKSIWSLESFVMADIIDNLRKRLGMQPYFNLDVHKLIVQRKG